METTRQNIISKAFGLFLTSSYREVTLNRLLSETGLSKGAFYHYFESKEDLLAEVVDQFFFGATEGAAFLPDEQASFVDNMTRLLDLKKQAFVWFAQKYGLKENETNFFLFIVEAIRYLPLVRDKVEAMVAQEINTVKAILLCSANRGEIRESLDLDFLAGHIVRAFDGYEMHGVLLGHSSKTHMEELIMVSQIWKLIKKA